MVGYAGKHRSSEQNWQSSERLHPGRFCEISAVCTDPDYRHQGYARRLVLHLMGTILARGEVPMLHCSADNVPAIQLYEQLGFTLRCLNSFQVVRFVGVDRAGAAEG